jgi:ankyrin repeat protein
MSSLDRPTAEAAIREAGERPDRARALLRSAPDLRGDPWVALTLGDASLIDDAVTSGGPLQLTPLAYVARSRIAGGATATAARELLDRGALPDGSGGEEWTILSVACARGDSELVEILLQAGANPNDSDSLYHSVEVADDSCTRLLLAHGATAADTVALHHALDHDRLDRVALLLAHGADPNESPDWPALHHAVIRDRSPAFLELLLHQGADPGARDQHGRTAYQLAFRRARDEVAGFLAEHGSPDDVSDSDRAVNAIVRGRVAPASDLDNDARQVLIELAMGDLEGLRQVVQAVGPRFRGGTPEGTLLHHAAWLGRPDHVRYLLERGARVDETVQTEYATPLGWAAVGSRYRDGLGGDWVAAAQALAEAGAEIDGRLIEMAAPPLSEWLARAAGNP